MRSLSLILTSMRPQQWAKNGLIFAPLIFAHRAGDAAAIASVTVTFLLFCLLSGGTYLVNDLLDREKDREHPLKRSRPVASGALAPPVAAAAGGIALLSSVAGGLLVGRGVALAMAGYLVLTLAYSLFLKHVVILDVMTLASGFLIRVAAGALAIPVDMSFWLFICTGLLALFLAFGKRRHELVLLEADASAHRPILKEYSPYFLDQMISVVATSTVVAYALYTISPEVQEKLGTSLMGLTIPFVLYGVFRYLYLVHQREKGGDPTQVIVTDMPLLVDILLWAAVVVALLYTGR